MSTPQQKAKEVFVELINNVESEQWHDRALELCDGDNEVLMKVRALLEAHRDPHSFLDRPAFDAEETIEHSEPIMEKAGSNVGPYKLLQQIGEGGMGVVFMAEQTHPVQRRVALKIVKPGMDTRQVIARFEAERQALALMDHPNIAKVLDAGATEAGRPYFVMELVKGVPITKYCDERRLTPRDRLELFIPVCQAVQHAHLKGVIHRDLKPSNVLIAAYDGKPVPKIIDFGVAKATGQKLTEKTMFTEFGSVVGTLEYMSPEQAELNQLDIDTRSDVYSLGVLLYELLTGSTPLEHDRVMATALHEVLRFIREEDPPKPSTRLSTSSDLPAVATNRGTEPSHLQGVVSGELDWIVMKSLEKDRGRRYESASALGADLDRYLSNEVVQACPPSPWYRFRKLTRRNKVAIITTGLVVASLLVGTVVSLWQMTVARSAESHARNNLAEAVAAEVRATRAEKLATERLASEEQARRDATSAALRARRFQYASDMLLVQNAFERHDVLRAQQLLDRHFPQDDQEDLRGFEWHHFWKRAHPGLLANVTFGSENGSGGSLLAVSQDGNYCATDFNYWWIVVLDLRSQSTIAKVNAGFTVTGLWIDASHRRLFAVGNQGQFRWWEDWDDSNSHTIDAHQGPVNMLVRIPDQSGFVTCGDDGLIKVWGNEPNTPLRIIPLPEGMSCRAVVSPPDQKLIAALGRSKAGAGEDKALYMFDSTTGELRWESNLWADERVVLYLSNRLAFSPNGQQLAYARSSVDFTLLSAATGKPVGDFDTLNQSMSWIGYSPDGSRLAGLPWEGGNVYLWDSTTREFIDLVLPHKSIRHAQWCDDGRLLTSGPMRICVWDPRQAEFQATVSINQVANSNDFMVGAVRSASRRLLLVNANGPLCTLWDLQNGNLLHSYRSSHLRPKLVSDGNTIISSTQTAVLKQTMEDSEPTIVYSHEDPQTKITKLAVTLDGQTAAIVSMPDWSGGPTEVGVRLIDIERQKPLTQFVASQDPVSQIAFSPDGRYLVYVDFVGKIRCWDTRDRRFLWESTVAYARHTCIASTDDGEIIALGDPNGNVEILQMDSGRLVRSFGNHGFPVNDIDFSPDGRRLAVGYGQFGTNTGEVCLWDMTTGQMTARLGRNLDPVMGITFSKDGHLLVSVHGDGLMSFWRSATAAEVESQRWQP